MRKCFLLAFTTLFLSINSGCLKIDDVNNESIPEINSFTPGSGVAGITVIISGVNFSTIASENIVKFNGVTANVISATASSITVTVPENALTGPITVTVGSNTAISTTNFNVTQIVTNTTPSITGFSPVIGNVGTIVTVSGTNFSTIPSENIVKFNGITANVTSATTSQLTASVPSGSTTGSVTVTVANETATSASLFLMQNSSNDVLITYSGTSATITNPLQNSGITASVDNGNVVINSTVTDKEINYILSGTTTNGSFKIYSEYKFNLVLNGISITNSSGPAINIQSSKKTTLVAMAGTTNNFTDGTIYSTSSEDQKGTIFSEGQIVFSGDGIINVSGNNKHAVCSDDYVSINSGSLTVLKAVKDGIHANDYFSISGGVVRIAATDDGVQCEEGYVEILGGTVDITTSGSAYYDSSNSDIASSAGINCFGDMVVSLGKVTIASSGKGGKGVTVDGSMLISGGEINITTTGSLFRYSNSLTSEAKAIKCDKAFTMDGGSLNISSMDDGIKSEISVTINAGTVNITKSGEGMEAPAITFKNGNVSIVSSDDCVNGTKGNGGEFNDGSIVTFAGGVVYMSTTGGDAIDSNGNVVMTGGTVIAQGPQSAPEVAIDVNGSFNISGGLLIGSGPNAGNMIEGPSTSSSQYSVLIKTNFTAGTLFTIQNAAGTKLVTYAPVRNASYFVFSSPSLVSGSSYKVITGGSCTGATITGGYYSGGTFTGGTQKGTFNLTSKLTTVTL